MRRMPFVSVVIPCRNEARYIRRVVASVLSFRYPRERLEVLFVDGQSSDGTRKILEDAARQNSFIQVLDNPKRTAPGFVDTVPCGTFPRSALDEVGLFDERLTRNQDNELAARIRRSGYKVAFDPAIQITYCNQPSLSGLLRQAARNGMWNVYTLMLHPYTWKGRHFVPGASASAGAEQGGRARVALTFLSYHVAYGLGTHVGLANLLTGRWRAQLGRPLAK